MRFALFLSLLLMASGLRAEVWLPGYKLLHRDASPKKSFWIEHHGTISADDFRTQVWLVGVHDRNERHILFQPDDIDARYDPDILISPDEKWLVRTQKRGSDEIYSALYRRRDGLTFKETPGLQDKAWRFLALSLGLAPSRVPPHHRYMSCIRWVGPTQFILLLWGSNCPDYGLDDWRCVYDVQSGQFSVPKKFAGRNRRALLGCH